MASGISWDRLVGLSPEEIRIAFTLIDKVSFAHIHRLALRMILLTLVRKSELVDVAARADCVNQRRSRGGIPEEPKKLAHMLVRARGTPEREAQPVGALEALRESFGVERHEPDGNEPRPGLRVSHPLD